MKYPVNIELLTKVKTHLERFPQSANMDYFEKNDTEAQKECRAPSRWDGIAGCIGGHSIRLSGGETVKNNDSGGHRNWNLARARLGLSHEETNQLLCFDHEDVTGPYEDLRDDLLRANIGTPEYAAVVIKAIDRCIALHSPKPDVIDVEANVLCASVEAEIKDKGWKEKVCASLVGVAVLVLAFFLLPLISQASTVCPPVLTPDSQFVPPTCPGYGAPIIINPGVTVQVKFNDNWGIVGNDFDFNDLWALVMTTLQNVVSVTWDGSNSALNDSLYFGTEYLFSDQSHPLPVTLGTFATGSELVLSILTPAGRINTGPAGMNGDGLVGAVVTTQPSGVPEPDAFVLTCLGLAFVSASVWFKRVRRG